MNLQNNMPDSAPLRDVVVVGSGNVAESLARAVAAAEGLRLVQIFARNAARGAAARPHPVRPGAPIPRRWPPPISIWSP